MPTYAFRDASGDLVLSAPELGKPIPWHAQTDAAREAVASVARAGAARRLAIAEEMITDHGTPPVKPYDKPVVTAGARKLVALAEAAGFETNVVALADRCAVEAWKRDERIAFRAHWHRGRADGGTWHEPYRYALVTDERPVGVNKISRTGLAGKRPMGVGTTRLRMLGTPKGMPVTLTEIEKRVRER